MINNHQDKSNMITTMTDASATRAAVERKTQILRITLGLTVLSFITFLITLTSSKWIVITYPANFTTRQNISVVRSTYGIIWECSIGKSKTSLVFGTYVYRSIFYVYSKKTNRNKISKTLKGYNMFLIITFLTNNRKNT